MARTRKRIPQGQLDLIYEKTYDELVNLKTNSKLVPGGKYEITDYRTTHEFYSDAGVIHQATIEPLIITALDVNKFSKEARSKTYPKHDIVYDFDNNVCEDAATPRPGFIIERYDPDTQTRTKFDYLGCKVRLRKITGKRYDLTPTKLNDTTVEATTNAFVPSLSNRSKYEVKFETMTHPQGEMNITITYQNGSLTKRLLYHLDQTASGVIPANYLSGKGGTIIYNPLLDAFVFMGFRDIGVEFIGTYTSPYSHSGSNVLSIANSINFEIGDTNDFQDFSVFEGDHFNVNIPGGYNTQTGLPTSVFKGNIENVHINNFLQWTIFTKSLNGFRVGGGIYASIIDSPEQDHVTDKDIWSTLILNSGLSFGNIGHSFKALSSVVLNPSLNMQTDLLDRVTLIQQSGSNFNANATISESNLFISGINVGGSVPNNFYINAPVYRSLIGFYNGNTLVVSEVLNNQTLYSRDNTKNNLLGNTVVKNLNIDSLQTASGTITPIGTDSNKNVVEYIPDAIYLDTVDDLSTFVRGNTDYVVVKDKLRGGNFNYVTEVNFSGSADFGISFPAQDGGYWVRDFGNEVLGDWYITDIATGYDITNALIFCIENNLNFKGRENHKYIITSEIEFATYSNITFDFGGAEITDNITAYWPVEAAGRAAPLFTIYNTNNVTVKNFTWIKGASRSNLVDEGVPTFIFWIGGQTLGTEFTSNFEVHNVDFKDCTAIGFGGVGVIGEVFNGTVVNLTFTGAWSYGINFEFGVAPEDPGINATFENGQHPYNIEVKNVKGIDMPNTRGFLRTASTFNITFTNCVGSNVKSFIMVFGGDKDISRVGQNVTFINCNHHSGGQNQLSVANYVVNILFPNEFNGSPLPAWTNLNHNITFINCEFQCNSVVGSANIRFSGNQGKTLFKNVILRNGYYGVRTGLTTGITYTSVHSLELDNCQFLNLSQPLSIRNIKGVLVKDCKFENSVGTLIPVILENATHCKFYNNYFGSLQNDNTQIHINSTSTFTYLEDNEFTSFTTRPILAEAITFGRNNLPRLTVLSNDPDTEANRYQIIGEPVTSIYQITALTTTLNASKAINYTLPSLSFTMDRIIGGVNGDIVSIDAIGVSASLTLTNLAAGAGNNKLFLKGNADITISASSTDFFGVKFKKYPTYWKQID